MDSDREDPHGAPCPDCGRTLWSGPSASHEHDWTCYLCDLRFNAPDYPPI